MANKSASTRRPITSSTKGVICLIVLCAVYLLIALWVFQVSRTGASPARVQMAVHVSFRAAFLVQAAAAAACGLVVLPVIFLLCLAASAFAEKYACS